MKRIKEKYQDLHVSICLTAISQCFTVSKPITIWYNEQLVLGGKIFCIFGPSYIEVTEECEVWESFDIFTIVGIATDERINIFKYLSFSESATPSTEIKNEKKKTKEKKRKKKK